MPAGRGKDAALSVADLIEPKGTPLLARARNMGRNARSAGRNLHRNVSDVFEGFDVSV